MRPGRALFGAVIGGYGMFGVMTSVTLKTNVNAPLTMEHVLTTSADEFARVFPSLRGADVEVKLCRLQLQDLERVDVYVFRRSAPEGSAPSPTLACDPERCRGPCRSCTSG